MLPRSTKRGSYPQRYSLQPGREETGRGQTKSAPDEARDAAFHRSFESARPVVVATFDSFGGNSSDSAEEDTRSNAPK